VFALDAATGEKLWDTVPMPGEHGVNGLAFDDQGRLFGLTAGKSFELDLATHQVSRSAEYVAWNWPPTVGFQPRAVNLVFDPHDGFLYGTVASRFVRIDPDTLVNTAPGVRAQPSLFATSPTGVGPKYFLQGNNRLVESLWYSAE
jgi:hypothetical protein